MSPFFSLCRHPVTAGGNALHPISVDGPSPGGGGGGQRGVPHPAPPTVSLSASVAAAMAGRSVSPAQVHASLIRNPYPGPGGYGGRGGVPPPPPPSTANRAPPSGAGSADLRYLQHFPPAHVAVASSQAAAVAAAAAARDSHPASAGPSAPGGANVYARNPVSLYYLRVLR